ncbi:MAG: OmpA family protein, partial [bacterium]|nr:OmpA family protein [bacterium]
GGLIGYTSLEMEDIEEITVMCMNDGPIDPPKKPIVEQKPEAKLTPAAPTKQEVEVKVIIEAPREPLRLSMEGPKEPIKVQVETKAVPVPIPVPVIPPAPLAPKEEKCEMPEITIYFDFDKSDIKEQEVPRVAMIAYWLKANPQCKVQVEGHACKIGTDDYNASLGRRRAKAVYDLLIGKGISSSQVSQFVSVSEDKPADFEKLEKNRRVIIRLMGEASGK